MDSVGRPRPAISVVVVTHDMANAGVGLARGDAVGIVLDGARMVTPGIIANARRGLALDRRAVVATFAWHLGPYHQSRSALQGYDPATEDGLLDSIAWPADGYRLFEIAALAGSNPGGWVGPLTESCWLFMGRALYGELAATTSGSSFPQEASSTSRHVRAGL